METYIHCTPSSLSRITHMSLLFLFSNFPLGLYRAGLSWTILELPLIHIQNKQYSKLCKAGVSKQQGFTFAPDLQFLFSWYQKVQTKTQHICGQMESRSQMLNKGILLFGPVSTFPSIQFHHIYNLPQSWNITRRTNLGNRVGFIHN